MCSHKKWIKSVLAHEETDAVPYNLMFCPTAYERLARYYNTDNLDEQLNLPLRMTWAHSVKPVYANPAIYGETIADEHGVIWSTSLVDRGSPICPCLRKPVLSQYIFPDPTASYRFEGFAEACATYFAHYNILWVGDL